MGYMGVVSGGSNMMKPGLWTDTAFVNGRAKVEKKLLCTLTWWQEAWLPVRKEGRTL